MDSRNSGAIASDSERTLYRWRDPSPAQVGRALGISGQHVKDICKRLDLEMIDKSAPGSSYPRWRIPLKTFRALRAQIGDRHSP